MCGIYVCVRKDGQKVQRSVLKKATDVISHRGPDGEGHFLHNNVGLGHRRLSIIDLSSHADQPMFHGDDLVMVFNGEIYNYLEIRQELIRLGHQFKTNSDTEVLMASYRQWGEHCVEKFNGMWAFAIYDIPKGQLFASRDRFGIKPLYLYEDAEQIILASEIKQILVSVNHDFTANVNIVLDYLALSYLNHTTTTFFDGIESLKQGENLLLDTSGSCEVKLKPYYDLIIKPEYSNMSLDEATEQFISLFERSVELRLRSDVKVGSCLSGGLDSSSLVSMIDLLRHRKSDNEEFLAITASSKEKGNDETHFAKMVTNASNLDWVCTSPSTADFWDKVEDIIYGQEEPFVSPSIVFQYFVFKKAKESGIKVMMDGQGGDETMLGYERYYFSVVNDLPLLARPGYFRMIHKNSKLSAKQVAMMHFYFNNSFLKQQKILKQSDYLAPKYRSQINKSLIEASVKAFDSVADLQKSEILGGQMQKLLKFEDRNSMLNSIEARVPFIDYKLVEFNYSLHHSLKIHEGWTKYILRKSIQKQLPHGIVWRKNKFGFEAPTKWLVEHKADMENHIKQSKLIEELIGGKPTEIAGSNLWRLYNLSKWSEMYSIGLK